MEKGGFHGGQCLQELVKGSRLTGVAHEGRYFLLPVSLTHNFTQVFDRQLWSLQLSRHMMSLPACWQRPLARHLSLLRQHMLYGWTVLHGA